MDAPRLQHIRQPLPARGGNQFYRDRRDFSGLVKTYCGADVTAYDVNRREVTTKKARQFYAKNAATWVLCADCKTKAGVL